MTTAKSRDPVVSTTQDAHVTRFLGVDFAVLLPRERSECVEILLETFPKGLEFPVHKHKECEQTYIFLEGEGELTLNGTKQKITKGGIVYIPRMVDHAVSNVGDSELKYIVVETYPEGYLPDEPSWDAHIEVLSNRYGVRSEKLK